MSKLAALLDELCPDGVEFAPFLDVVDVLNGAAFSSKQFNTAGEGLPLIRVRDVLRGRSETYYRGKYEDRYLVNPGDILIGMDGNFHVGRWGTEVALLNQRVCKVESKDDQQLLNGFLYYFAQPYFKALESSIPSGTVKHLSMVKMKSIFIPVPPLEVQQEIVRVLDAFTDLEQSLVSELELRKKQYAFHRDELLNFTPNVDDLCPEGVEYRSLGEVGEFLRGSSLQKKHLISGGVPCIHYGQVYTRYGLSANETYSFLDPEFAAGKRTMTTGDLFIATTSENEEELGKAVAWLGQEEVVASNDAFIYRHNLDPMYVSYFFASSYFHDQKYPFITGAKVRRLSGESMAKILIPVPPLEVQQEIVAKLDTFSGLIQSLEQEISLRRKQYEFYRDELLSFTPKKD